MLLGNENLPYQKQKSIRFGISKSIQELVLIIVWGNLQITRWPNRDKKVFIVHSAQDE